MAPGMGAAVDFSNLGSFGFCDINSSTSRPADRADVRPQHPKTRPHADTRRHGGAPFNASIDRCVVKTLGLHSGGGEAKSVGGFLLGHDVQQTIMDVSVVSVTSVIL